MSTEFKERNKNIYDLFISGLPVNSIANKCSISRSRVNQIINRELRRRYYYPNRSHPLYKIAIWDNLVSVETVCLLFLNGIFDIATLKARLKALKPNELIGINSRRIDELKRAFEVR